jgi:hypothetical protein
VIDKKERFVGFDRFSVQALSNIHDFWPRLLARCGNVIGEPEDYEIWHNRRKVDELLKTGEGYEIIAKRTPRFVLPSQLRKASRISVDLGDPRAALWPSPKAREAPLIRRSEAEAERDVPPHVRAYVTFQDQNRPAKE